MLISDKLVYVDLQKTGGSHILKILSGIPSLNSHIYGKRTLYHTIPENLLSGFDSKIKVGSIRNPWDWYVSIWAFGCLGRGGLHYRLTKLPKLSSVSGMKKFLFHSSERREWKHLYKDSSNPTLFRQWLKYILIERKSDFGEGYGESVISGFAGLLTFRYLKIYNYNFHLESESILNYNKLIEFDRKNNFIDIMIRTENLHGGLLENASKMGIPFQEIEDSIDRIKEKTNQSARKFYQYYYDEETTELVREKERFIIEKYDYKFHS